MCSVVPLHFTISSDLHQIKYPCQCKKYYNIGIENKIIDLEVVFELGKVCLAIKQNCPSQIL